MNFCCLYLGALFHRAPNPPSASLPSDPARHAEDRPSIGVSKKISGKAGPLTIEQNWLETQGSLLSIGERDQLEDAIRVLKGDTPLVRNKYFPLQLSGILSLSDGREISYVHNAQNSEWDGKDWGPPRDKRLPQSIPRQIIKIAVIKHDEVLVWIDSNPLHDIPEDESISSRNADRLFHLVHVSNL